MFPCKRGSIGGELKQLNGIASYNAEAPTCKCDHLRHPDPMAMVLAASGFSVW